ncbi:MAG: hypothetical protein D6B25_16145 [Desulfobulbaceae bacterium]|nr:MAG: hypothetical protein D6B25_16145 [Desulfobulbaceae bacterium]
MRALLGKTLLLLLFVPLFCFAQESETTIVYLSANAEIYDFKGKGGIPSLASLLKKIRSENQNVVVLHGGGAIAPSTLSSFDRGAHMIDLLNHLQVDGLSVAKSELAYSEDELTLRSQEASFPFISSNIHDPLSKGSIEGVERSVIIEAGTISIGVISAIDPEVTLDYLPTRVRIIDIKDSVEKEVAHLKKQGADLIILMTDYHFPEAPFFLESGLVDMVLTSKNDDQTIAVSKGFYLEHGRSDSAALIRVLPGGATDDGGRHRYSFKFESFADYPADQKLQTMVAQYLRLLTDILEIEVGVTETELDTRRESVRTAENAFGNLVADAIREFYDADIGLMNGGGIRGDKVYPPGTRLTRGDIHREIPFRNHVVQLRVTGSQIREAIENGLSRIQDVKGRYPHLSGMAVEYNSALPPGQRIVSIKVNNKILLPEQNYTLATVSFLAEGGDGYDAFSGAERLDLHGSSRLLWEYVRDYISSQKVIAPTIQGRLRDISR